jgi:long-chain alkane monooxygenase
MADEFMAAVTSLWDGWEPDSVVNDLEKRTFTDPSKVHRSDFTGTWWSTRGPLVSGPLPQGRAVIAQAGGSARGRQFAAQHADTIVGTGLTVEAMKAYRDDVRERAAGAGRNPDEIRIMFLTNPVIGATEAEALDRVEAQRQRMMDDPSAQLANLSSLSGNDFSVFPLDEELDADKVKITGSQTTIGQFFELNKGLTLREAVVRRGMAGIGAHGLVGTPEQVAVRMGELVEAVGGDGLLIGNADVTRRMIAEVCDGLVPELQRRGLTRTEYTETTLRGHLREF